MVAYRPTELTDEEERAETAINVISDAAATVKSAATTTCTLGAPSASLRLLQQQQQPSSSTCRIDSLLFNPKFVFEQARRRHEARVDIDATCTTTLNPTRDSSEDSSSVKGKNVMDRARKARKDDLDNATPAPAPAATTKTITRSSTSKKNSTSNNTTKKGATPVANTTAGETSTPIVELGEYISAGKKPVHWKIPEELWRPAFQEVSNDAIVAADPRLDGVAPQYVRDQLEDFGSSLLFGMTGVKTIPPKNNVLLSHIDIVYPNVATIPPTHMVAVFSSLRARPATHPPVSIFPVHSIFLAAHCARLPLLAAPTALEVARPNSRAERTRTERTASPGSDSSSSGSGSTTTVTPLSTHRHARTDVLTLPVLRIGLPDPDTFSMLVGYLYHKRTDILLAKLLPLPPPPKLEVNQLIEIPRFGREIGRVCGWQKVFRGLWRVRGLWMNVCQLGIFDEYLWDTLELAWEVLVVAWGVEEGPGDGGKKGEDNLDDVPQSPREYEADRSG